MKFGVYIELLAAELRSGVSYVHVGMYGLHMYLPTYTNGLIGGYLDKIVGSALG